MPVNLDAFRSAVSNARGDSFIRMSQSKPDGIVNYGKSFLGRKLGWYRHATEAQNQQVREQLYLALKGDGAELQRSTLDRIRLQLGIDSAGKSSLTTQLTAREIKMIIADTDADRAKLQARQEVKDEHPNVNSAPANEDVADQGGYPWGKVFDKRLGPAFINMFEKEYETAGLRGANEELGTFKEMYKDVIKDLLRSGSGLKLDGKVISRVGESKINGEVDAIKEYFDEDDTDGVVISRVMSDILHQGFPAIALHCLADSGEGIGMTLMNFNSEAFEFDVHRVANGNYLVNAKYTAIPEVGIDGNYNMHTLDPVRSRIDFECTIRVVTDTRTSDNAKVGQVTLDSPPKLHAELHKTLFSKIELDILDNLVDEDGFELKSAVMQAPELGGDKRFKALLAARPINLNAVYNYVKEKIILPKDESVLYALGLCKNAVEQLLTGLDPDARVTKDLMKRLSGADENVRARALNELKSLCQKLVARGWHAPMEEFDPNDIALVTVGGLKIQKGFAQYGDLNLVREYIKSSNDDNIRRFPEALASNDPATQAAAKERLKQVVLDARRAQGAKILWSVPKFENGADIKLLENASEDYQDIIKRHLENIVQKNQFMKDSVMILGIIARRLEKLA